MHRYAAAAGGLGFAVFRGSRVFRVVRVLGRTVVQPQQRAAHPLGNVHPRWVDFLGSCRAGASGMRLALGSWGRRHVDRDKAPEPAFVLSVVVVDVVVVASTPASLIGLVATVGGRDTPLHPVGTVHLAIQGSLGQSNTFPLPRL